MAGTLDTTFLSICSSIVHFMDVHMSDDYILFFSCTLWPCFFFLYFKMLSGIALIFLYYNCLQFGLMTVSILVLIFYKLVRRFALRDKFLANLPLKA